VKSQIELEKKVTFYCIITHFLITKEIVEKLETINFKKKTQKQKQTKKFISILFLKIHVHA
jgi:hypothetical protein